MSLHNARRVPLRFLARLGALAGTALAVSVCGSQDRLASGGTTAPGADATFPVVQIILPTDTLIEIADSLKFTVNATDNAKLKSAQVTVVGLGTFVLAVSKDTTFVVGTTVTMYTQAFVVPLPTNAAGQRIAISATATDGSDNVTTHTDTVRVNDAQPPVVVMLSPTAGVAVGSGDTIHILARATDPSGIRYLGARLFVRDTVLGRVQTLAVDSLLYTSRQYMRLDSFRILVPTSLTPGNYILQVFSADSSPSFNKGASADLAIAVRDISAPTGTFNAPAVDAPIIAGDTLTVSFHATDNVGVVSLRFRGYGVHADPLLGPPDTTLRFQAQTAQFPRHPADTTPVVRRLLAVLADSTPDSVMVEATLTDIGGNVTTVTRRIQVVAGPRVLLTAPASGARVPVGTSVSVTVTGSDPRNVTYVGYAARGAVTHADSVAVSPAATSATRTLSWAVPPGAALGTDTLVPFATNATGGRFTGTSVLISFADTVRPTVTIDTPAVAQLPVNVGDSVYVRVHVRDNRGVTQVVLTGTAQRGSVALGTDTVVTRFAPRTVTIPPTADTVITRYLRAEPVSTSEVVTITATATDSSGNSGSSTATIRVVSGPALTIVRPVPGTLTSAGKKLVVEVQALDPNGIRLVGWRTTGVVNVSDSLSYSASRGVQPKTVNFIDTLLIPEAVALGTFTIQPFAVDSLGDPSGVVSGITVTVQSAAADSTPPTVTFNVSRRIEATDSITVAATDASGIGSLTWRATKLGDTLTVYGSGTTGALPGTSSDVRATFAMNLVGITRYPTQVVVRATATDSSRTRTGIAAAETLTVVAGRTFALPSGSSIGDAIYNPNRNELYLSNTALDRIEVFDVATSSFVASIPVGSRPVGLALWPKDTTTLANEDTLIVANSGGANLSIVDVRAGVRREVQRYRLPNYVIQKVKTQKDATTGVTRLTITEYDYADRPQYVAAVCRYRLTGGQANCGDVLALYSTTPTPGQAGYPNRGYLAWENLTSTAIDGAKGHFFWEQAASGLTLTTDTLQIIEVRDSVPGVPVRRNILGAGVGQIVDFDLLQFQDSTFVRNSGNYLRALVGEGGRNQGFARVMAFDPTPGVDTLYSPPPADTLAGCHAAGLYCLGAIDRGISDAVFVRDFIANRASGVSSIAINQNGLTMLVRADSIYAFNQTLGLTGIMRAGSGAVGMDFHPSNNFDANARGTGGFGGTGSPNNRLVFAARPDSSIDVFDTFFYGEVTDNSVGGATIPVPIRNSLIGPVRAATDGVNTLLFGLTAQGLVKVTLPSITNSLFPTAGLRASAPAPASVPRIVSSGARRTNRDPSPPRE